MKINDIFSKKYSIGKLSNFIKIDNFSKRNGHIKFYILSTSLCFLMSSVSVFASEQASSLLSSLLQVKPAAPPPAPTVAAPAPVTVPVTVPVTIPVTVPVPYTVQAPPMTLAASTTKSATTRPATTTTFTSGTANVQLYRSQSRQNQQQRYSNQEYSRNMQPYNGGYQEDYNQQKGYSYQQNQSQYYGNPQQEWNNQQGWSPYPENGQYRQDYNNQQGYDSQQGQPQNNYSGSQFSRAPQMPQQNYNNQQGYSPQQGQPQNNYNGFQFSGVPQMQQQNYMQQSWSAQNNYGAQPSGWSSQSPQGYNNQQSLQTQNNFGTQSPVSMQQQSQGYINQPSWSFSASTFPSNSAGAGAFTKPASTASLSSWGTQTQNYTASNSAGISGQPSFWGQSMSSITLTPARLDPSQNIDQQVQKQLNTLATELTDYKMFTEKMAIDADSAATQSANIAAKSILDAANLAINAASLQTNIREKEQRVLMALENAMRVANEANSVIQSSTTATKEEKDFSKTRLTNLEKTYKSMQKASVTAAESAGSIKSSAQAAMSAKSIFKPIFEATEAARKAKEASEKMLIAAKAAESDGPTVSYDLKNSDMLVSAARDCKGKFQDDCERRSKHCEWKEKTGCQFKCEAVTVKSLCLGISNETQCQWESNIDMCRTK